MSQNNTNMLATGSNIPLHCHVCIKKPNFSDVSHLLTHIASKGHLSAYYKTKLSDEPDDKEIIEEYDEWYEMWNVEELMKERLDQKEKKKSGSNGKANAASTSRRSLAATSSATTNTTRNTPVPSYSTARRSRTLRESTLDPQLGRRIKTEPRSRSNTPAPPFAFDPAALNRAYAPPMQTWATTPYSLSPNTQETSIFDSINSDSSDDSDFSDMPSFKKTKTAKTPRARKTSKASRRNNSVELPPPGSDDGKIPGDTVDEPRVKLPAGMAQWFDSADKEGRKNRNQKKAPHVVLRMEQESLLITPTELVSKPNDFGWALRAERKITGHPLSDDKLDHISGESTPEASSPPPPKKKKAVRKPRVTALTAKNVNTGYPIRKPRRDSHHTSSSQQSQLDKPYFTNVDGDSKLTYGSNRNMRPAGVRVHHDDSGPTITFDSMSMSTLTSGLSTQTYGAQFQQQSAFQVANNLFNLQQSRPRGSMSRSFRPSNGNNPINLPPNNFASFGQLNASSMGSGMMFGNTNPIVDMGGTYNVAPQYQQPAIKGTQSYNGGNIFQNQGMQSLGAQDPFSSNGFNMLGPDAGFNVGGGFGSGENRLFLSSNQEDDDATVSAPQSER